MMTLTKGQFFGQTNNTTHLNGITLTDTEYTHEKVDWHYHQNAYFTLILEGRVIEGNKKEVYQCPAGTLLFHNWQESHYNIKPKGYTRGFHIEVEKEWFDTQELQVSQGSVKLSHPAIKISAYQILKESKIDDTTSPLAIHALLSGVFAQMDHLTSIHERATPSWVSLLKEMLHDDPAEEWSLHSLGETAGVHPVHLSRQFSKYFGCNLGDYIRNLKVEKALSLLGDPNLSLTAIAHHCGFADQSHFIRCFKAVNGLKPYGFKRLLSNRPC